MIKTPVVQAIEEALTKYAFADLCEGADVRDTLLDLLLIAKGPSEPPVEVDPDSGMAYAQVTEN